MRKIYLLVSLITLFITNQAYSQQFTTEVGRTKLGLNVGGTFQSGGISNDHFGLAYGATLEYALIENGYSYYGLSFRGRYLKGETFGNNFNLHSGSISNNAINGISNPLIDYSGSPLYLNNKTSFDEFSLELMLKWNKLYQNKGILLYLFLGGGATEYTSETDQLDANNNMYNYSTITSSNLKSIQDGNYETKLDHPDYNSLVFTPTVGAGFGFRLAPAITLAFEHKISLPQTNLFDGQINQPSSNPAFVKDVYHYSSLGFIFNLTKRVPIKTETHTEPIIDANTYTVPGGGTSTHIAKDNTPKQPKITLTQPILNSFNTPKCKVNIVATTENIISQKNITFYHNNNKIPSYQYFYYSNEFKSTIQLKEGKNSFTIVAVNGDFKDSTQFDLICVDNQVITIPICHKKSNGATENIIINEADWKLHQAHGDVKGNCPVAKEKMITICHKISGKIGVTETVVIPESKLAIHQSHGDKIGECITSKLIEDKQVIICHNNTSTGKKESISISESSWIQHQSHGDVKGICITPLEQKMTICHVPSSGNVRQSLTINKSEWYIHQAHGDIIGTCPPQEKMITICHKNNGRKGTLIIPEFRWQEHLSHGDSRGECPDASIIICHRNTNGTKQTISISQSAWNQHQSHGDSKGVCPSPVSEKKITICHYPPGNRNNPQSLQIPISAWAAHQAHGDVKGVCPPPPVDKNIIICHKQGNSSQSITIKESQWSYHQSHGDTKGTCPPPPPVDNNITICHKQGTSSQTMTIKESQWKSHQAHGDIKGTCPPPPPEKKITICHYPPGNKNNPQAIQIPESAWPAHQAHGDIKGACPPPPPVDNNITICHKQGTSSQAMTIKESQWKLHQAHGDIKGTCPPPPVNKKITICHYPPGNKTNPQNIQISPSAWPAHEKHGDKKGSCN